MPLVLTSQADPVFALAPLLVLWLGFGMSAKVAMAVAGDFLSGDFRLL